MTTIGQRAELVQIQHQVEGLDELNGPILEWLKFVDVWANILHRTGLEVLRSDAPTSIVQASIRIPFLAAEGVTAAMRVLCADGTVYNIKGVLPDRVRREYVDLVCETGSADG